MQVSCCGNASATKGFTLGQNFLRQRDQWFVLEACGSKAFLQAIAKVNQAGNT